jgi:amino acid permease
MTGKLSKKDISSEVLIYSTLGVVFLVIMILQHFGGVIAYYTGKPNPLHRKFGRYVAMLGRIIAIFGWLLGGNQQNAIIVGVASAVILVISAVLPSPSKPGNRS